MELFPEYNNYPIKVIKCHYHLIITVQPNTLSAMGCNVVSQNI